MADSFFGFNTSLDELEDVCTLEASEDEYDALNDETFGEMVDGDWEQQHEEFSLLTENNKHMDIEGTLSNLMIDNDDDLPSQFHITPNKSGERQQSPSVGQNAHLPLLSSLKNVCTVEELERSLRQQQMPPNQQSPQMQQTQHQQMKQPPLMPFFQQQPRFPSGMIPPPQQPIMNAQQFGHPPGQPMPFRLPQPPPNHMQQQQQQQQHFGNFNMMPPNNMPSNQPRPPLPGHIPGMELQNMFPPMHFNQQSNFNNQHPHHPNNINQQRFPINPQQMPPGNKPPFPPNQQFLHNQQFPMNQQFPPNQQFPLNQKGPINQQQLPLNQPPPNQHSGMNQQRPMQNQPSSPLNQQRVQPNIMQNQQQQNNMNQQSVPNQVVPNKNVNPPPMMNSVNNNRPFPNVFNNSNGPNAKAQSDTNNLIQMIQNTHPMLQNNMHPGYLHPGYNAIVANSMLLARGMMPRHPNNMAAAMNNQNNMQKMGNENQRRQGNEIDPYSGLMSSREKQWLLNIQLLQLNTGTPYIDDYYYTVFLERKAKKEKEEVNEAHKVNQENHPFSRQNLNNSKFNQYNNHSGGGSGGRQGEGRERCNSTRSNNDNPQPNKDGPRTYVPTQFENSLGKLQCGSVTAPRKIIDMEIIGCESPTGETRSSNVSNPSAGVIGAPRGTRHILLAIETLYRILLRLEDMSEPLAIANALILKEREEKQKALLDQQQKEVSENIDDGDDNTSPDEPATTLLADIENAQKQTSTRTSTDGSLSLSGAISSGLNSNSSQTNLLKENKTDLLEKLFAGLLFEDRLSAFMNIRKGKMLVLRILAQAEPTNTWRAPLGRVWPRLLRTLPFAIRRDPGILNPLTDYFHQYLSGTEGWAPVSDICLMLSEGSPSTPQGQRASSVPLRSATPSLPQRSLMHFIMSTTLGLSLLVALMERASALPKPLPAAWNNMMKCAGRLVGVSGNARPPYPISRSLIATYAVTADLPPGMEESLAEVLAKC